MLKTKPKLYKKFSRLVLAVFCCLSFGLVATPALAQTSNNKDCFNGKCPTAQQLTNKLQQNPIIKDIQVIVNALGAAVAVVVTISIIFGGIQYSLSGDRADEVTKAKKRISNSLVALLIFILTFTFLQWLIPGGVFK